MFTEGILMQCRVHATVRVRFFTQVCYPKATDKPLYNGLVTQCKSLGLPFRDWASIKVGHHRLLHLSIDIHSGTAQAAACSVLRMQNASIFSISSDEH